MKEKILNERLGWHKAVYKEKVKCIQCDEMFKDETAHNVHHEEKHPGEPYYCQLCDAVFKDRNFYYRHKWNKHNKPYACDSCNFTTCKLPQITIHVFSKHMRKTKRSSKSKYNSINSDSKKRASRRSYDSNSLKPSEANKKSNENGDLVPLDVEVTKSIADDRLNLSDDVENEKIVDQNQTSKKTDLATSENMVNRNQTKDEIKNVDDMSRGIQNENSEMKNADQTNLDASIEDLVSNDDEQHSMQGK